MFNGDDESSKKFEAILLLLRNKNVFENDCESELFDNYPKIPFSGFFSNSDDTYCGDNENNKSKMISVKPKSSNSQKQSENSLNSSSNSISNKSKQNLNIINNKIIENKNNNKEDTINIDEKKDNKINANRERKGKQSIKFEIEKGKTNDKTNDQTNGQINNQANSNSINVPKNEISYNYPERIHDKNAADNQIKKMNTFLINAVLIVQSNKITKIYQASIQSPESNSLEKNEFVKINVSITSNTSVEFNQNLLFTTLKEILSFPISNKIKKYNEEHNKQITEKYYKECPIFKQFCDLYYGDIINLINDEDNSFEGLFDTYKEELEKSQDKEDIEKIIKNFPEVVKCRKKRKISP